MLKHVRSRVLLLGTFGNMLEWYDFTVYGYLSAILAPLFFPTVDPFLSYLAIFAVHSVAYIARPLGGILLGSIADRFGRKRVLLLSTALIAVPTVAMGLLPTYEQVGIVAPLLLTLCRLLQGFSIGGEHAAASLYLVENGGERRTFFGSFTFVGAAMGWLVASLFSTLTIGYSWRLPFLLGAVTALFTYFARKKMGETVDFLQTTRCNHPVRETLRKDRVPLFLLFGLYAQVAVVLNLLINYMPTYLHMQWGRPLREALTLNSWMVGLLLVTLPLAGLLAERVGKERLMQFSSLALFVLFYPLYTLIPTMPYFAIGILMMFVGLYVAVIPTVMAEMFPTERRASGIGIAYNMSASLFAGVTPLLVTYLIYFTGDAAAPAYWGMASAFCSLVALWGLDKFACESVVKENTLFR